MFIYLNPCTASEMFFFMRRWYSLYDKVYALHNLRESFTKVKQNNGVAGVDGQSVEAFKENLEAELYQLFVELKTKRYQPKPVKRVYAKKEDGRSRPLGIPTVRDRIVQQALLNVLQPIFDPHFHPSSYGYRPNRSAARAVAKAERFSNRYGLSYVVDMDISKCFDSLDHKLILQGVNSRVADGSVLFLVNQFLKSGMIEEGKYRSTELGCPQGGVISPLLMNIYLDSFDQYTKLLKIRIVRYADDILIFGRSRSDTGKYRHLATQYLEQELQLKVNESKTHLTDKWSGIAFLGFIITSGQVKINPKSIKKFKGKVRGLTSRSGGKNLAMQIWYLNDLLRGFSSYFRIGNSTRDYKKLMSWIRRRLRMKQLREWKSSRGLHRQLHRMGYRGNFTKISVYRWRNSLSQLVHQAMPNQWFDKLGLYNMATVKTKTLHRFYE